MPLGIPEDSLLTIGASTIKGPSVVHSKVAAAPHPQLPGLGQILGSSSVLSLPLQKK